VQQEWRRGATRDEAKQFAKTVPGALYMLPTDKDQMLLDLSSHVYREVVQWGIQLAKIACVNSRLGRHRAKTLVPDAAHPL